MSHLPAGFLRKIRALVVQTTHPLCFLLDSKHCLKMAMGDFTYYGYSPCKPGEDMGERLPFLIALQVTDPIVLRFMETPNQGSAHVHILPDDNDNILVVFIDANEQKSNQAKIQQKANELTLLHEQQCKLMQAMRLLEEELEAKIIEADEANQLKSRFIANMSHEFRTPLTSILGFTSRLKQDPQTSLKQHQYVAGLESGAKHLLELVENLLDQSQIEAGTLTNHPAPVDLGNVFDELEKEFQPLAEDHRLEFRVIRSAIPDRIMLDELRFKQIMVNLLGNAIKFTDEGMVGLSASWVDDELTISVSDTGPGIADIDRERIFDAFERLETKPGTGLGLSIVKHLVDAMTGELTLDSSPGKGSRFEIKLPAMRVHGADNVQSERPIDKIGRSSTSPIAVTILVAEDERCIMNLMESVLHEAGYKTLSATDGHDAVEVALKAHPDLVLMDLNMPKMDGFTAIKALRSKGFSPPIFANSAWSSAEHKSKALEAGCNEYLLKPMDFPRLLELISEYIGKR